MKKDKLNIGDAVRLNGMGLFIIKDIKKHGFGYCKCCFSSMYFLYQISEIFWVDRDMLSKLKKCD